jgi:hypothetical protein
VAATRRARDGGRGGLSSVYALVGDPCITPYNDYNTICLSGLIIVAICWSVKKNTKKEKNIALIFD